MANIRITSLELALGSLIIAALAVVASIVMAFIAVRGQRRLASEQHQRKMKDRVYASALERYAGKHEDTAAERLAEVRGSIVAQMMMYARDPRPCQLVIAN